MCWECSATARDARRSMALVSGERIGRHDLDRLLRPRLAVDLPDRIKELRIHFGRFFATPIAKEPVQLLQHRGVVLPVDHERGVDRFLGVGMMEVDRTCIAIGDGILGRGRRQKNDGPGQGCEYGAAAMMRLWARFADAIGSMRNSLLQGRDPQNTPKD